MVVSIFKKKNSVYNSGLCAKIRVLTQLSESKQTSPFTETSNYSLQQIEFIKSIS